jgi:Protein of unknown function (DUF3137)
MINIDFSKLPADLRDKIGLGEISSLNTLFADEAIQSQLTEIENQRKKRKTWKIAVYGACLLITWSLSWILGDGDFVKWFFYQISGGNDTYSPTIWAAIASYTVGMGILYSIFASRIEIPLKSEVLKKICPLLYSKLEYSYDGKYSFDELEILRSKNFLNSYDCIERVEDSIQFQVEKDGKTFIVHGFELETSEMKWSGKNRHRETTNHDYLLKAHFPQARIPLTSDLMIVQDQAETKGIWRIIVALLLGLFIGMLSLVLLINLGTLSIEINMMICGIIGIVGSLGYWIYKKKSIATNRIQLENLEFEKLFDVKCEDQVTSRMIITPAFMDRIVSFVQKTGNQYEFIFQQNNIYIKRQIQGTYLEVGTEKNILTNLKGFAQFYLDMREILMFVYDMNLLYLSRTDAHILENTQTQEYHVIPIAWSSEDLATKNSTTWWSISNIGNLIGIGRRFLQ